MMEGMVRRVEARVREAQGRRIDALAATIKGVLASAFVETDGAQIMIKGRGVLKAWLADPTLRFLSGGPK
jgi:hypothetical protein